MSEITETSPVGEIEDIRLIIPIFLLKKLKEHPLTKGLYPVALGKSPQKKHYNIKLDKPNHHSLIYCQNGSGVLDYRDRSRPVKPGDLIILSPNESAHFHADRDEHCAAFWIFFEGDLAINFAERLLMKMDDGLATVGELASILTNLNYLLDLGSRGYTATNVIHAVHLLQQSLSYLALQLRLRAFNSSSKFDIDAVERMMRDNLHRDLNLDTLAHYSKLSKFHFAKKFKELTDTAPMQHFINMKIQNACSQLDNSDLTIKQIAASLGYSDPYYFSRLFKKSVGMSPKQYRDSRHG